MTDVSVKPRVLVVDDEGPLRELICVTLGDGYECVEAVDAAEAMRVMREQAPELVFLDVMLPDRSGLEVLQEMRADEALHDVPTVIVSAWQSPDDVTRALEHGADAFLPKPFQVEELESIAHEFVRRP
jgi:two-component system KDP operon response regulator KdpE